MKKSGGMLIVAPTSMERFTRPTVCSAAAASTAMLSGVQTGFVCVIEVEPSTKDIAKDQRLDQERPLRIGRCSWANAHDRALDAPCR